MSSTLQTGFLKGPIAGINAAPFLIFFPVTLGLPIFAQSLGWDPAYATLATIAPSVLLVVAVLASGRSRGVALLSVGSLTAGLCVVLSDMGLLSVLPVVGAVVATWVALRVAGDGPWLRSWDTDGAGQLRLLAAAAMASVPMVAVGMTLTLVAGVDPALGWWQPLLVQSGLILTLVPGILALVSASDEPSSRTAVHGLVALAVAFLYGWAAILGAAHAHAALALLVSGGACLALHARPRLALMIPLGAASGSVSTGGPDPVVGAGLAALGMATIAAAAARARAAERPPLAASLVEPAHADRLGALGTMAPAIAHELIQPLTAMVTFAAAARDLVGARRAADRALLAEAVEEISRQALRAAQIVRGLRDFAQRGDGHRRPESLAALLRAGADLAALGQSDRGTCVTILADEKLKVLADPVQVQQVVVNLVRNGLQALAGRDRRELRVEAREGTRGWIEVRVADTGPGLTAADEARLFQPFSSRKDGGMGLGLAICRDIVEDHGGRFWLENRRPDGATFAFTLPSVHDEDEHG